MMVAVIASALADNAAPRSTPSPCRKVGIINNVTMVSILLAGAALIREREHGTIEHLLVMPVTPVEIMTAKLWSMGLVVLLATAVALIFIVQGALGVTINGSVALFLSGAALTLFATLSMGIFIATLTRTMPQFSLALILQAETPF